ncbi:MAG TPA: transposase [Bryobacteraceae bacterium]|nr:transposase [Bryobacteraceae bacterium]
MPDGAHKGSFVQGFNAQIAVDSEAQIMVAAEITQPGNDKQQLAPMLNQVERNTGSKPLAASADTGYFSAEQVADERVQGVDLYIATGKQTHGEAQSAPAASETIQSADEELQTRILRGIAEINAAPVVHRWKKFEALTTS